MRPVTILREALQSAPESFPMTSSKFEDWSKGQITSLLEKKLPEKSELEKKIFELILKSLESELNELKRINEEQQRVHGYEKFDEYYSTFEQTILRIPINDAKDTETTGKCQIRTFENALDDLIDRLDQKVDKISEEVWEALKLEFFSSVVSTHRYKQFETLDLELYR